MLLRGGRLSLQTGVKQNDFICAFTDRFQLSLTRCPGYETKEHLTVEIWGEWRFRVCGDLGRLGECRDLGSVEIWGDLRSVEIWGWWKFGEVWGVWRFGETWGVWTFGQICGLWKFGKCGDLGRVEIWRVWKFGECGILLHCFYFRVHSKWLYK